MCVCAHLLWWSSRLQVGGLRGGYRCLLGRGEVWGRSLLLAIPTHTLLTVGRDLLKEPITKRLTAGSSLSCKKSHSENRSKIRLTTYSIHLALLDNVEQDFGNIPSERNWGKLSEKLQVQSPAKLPFSSYLSLPFSLSLSLSFSLSLYCSLSLPLSHTHSW